MDKIEHALKSGGTARAVKRKLGVGEHRAYDLAKKKDSVVTHIFYLVKAHDHTENQEVRSYGTVYNKR